MRAGHCDRVRHAGQARPDSGRLTCGARLPRSLRPLGRRARRALRARSCPPGHERMPLGPSARGGRAGRLPVRLRSARVDHVGPTVLGTPRPGQESPPPRVRAAAVSPEREHRGMAWCTQVAGRTRGSPAADGRGRGGLRPKRRQLRNREPRPACRRPRMERPPLPPDGTGRRLGGDRPLRRSPPVLHGRGVRERRG